MGDSRHIAPPGTSDEEPIQQNYPPDTGVRPWMQVVAGFFLMFNAWGIVLSFGVFQTFYTSGKQIEDHNSPSAVAWIGSVQTFFLLFGAAASGASFDKGFFRHMISLGILMIVLGLVTLSLTRRYYQVLLSQGFCVGLGMGMLLVPSVGLPSTWFSKRRGVAIGIVSSGASVAGIVLPIAVRALIPNAGFPWTARILAFASFSTLLISLSLARQRLKPRARGPLVDFRALKQLEFALYVVGLFVSMLGFYTFYTFAEKWATDSEIGLEQLDSIYILPLLNAASIVGRIGPSFCSDLIGPLNIQAPAMILCGFLVLVWIGVETAAGFVTLLLLYGIASGAVIALPPVVVASMTEDLRTFGGRMGLVFLAISFSSLAGPPINGAIIQSQNSTYDGSRIFSGCTLILGGCILWAARMIKTNLAIRVRA